MKRLLFIPLALSTSLGLVGCGTMGSAVDNTARFTTSTVGTGVGVVTSTGSAIGKGVGSVINTGAGMIGVKPATYNNVRYYQNQPVIYHNGQGYVKRNGTYVRVVN